MSPDDLTPERLDAILNGSEPAESDGERDMLALAASLREGSPRAGDDLRERVRAIAAPGHDTPHQRVPGWRTRFLIAGPAIATVVAAVVVIAVVGRDDSGTNQTSLTTSHAASVPEASTTGVPPSAARAAADTREAAPRSVAPQGATAGPVIVRVEPGTLPRHLAEARSIVTAAGGTVAVTRQTTGDPSALLAITLPPDRVSGVLAELMRLGEGRKATVSDAGGALRVLLTEGRSP